MLLCFLRSFDVRFLKAVSTKTLMALSDKMTKTYCLFDSNEGG